MKAIFKREFRAYMQGVIGPCLIAAVLLVAGVLSALYQVIFSSARFEYVLNLLALVLLVVAPLLAMHSLSEQKRNRVDRFLYSLPLRPFEVVVGRYLAMVAVLLVACGVLSLYPPVLALFGLGSIGTAYASLLGFFLLGAAMIALCFWLSMLTESPFVAMLLGVVASVTVYLIGSFSQGGAIGGTVGRLLTAMSPFSRFSLFCNGVFDVSTVIYDLSLVALFLCLSVQAAERKRRR